MSKYTPHFAKRWFFFFERRCPLLPFELGLFCDCCGALCVVVLCCSVLKCVAVCCCVLQYVAVCCSVLQCVAVCCNVLQCVAVCCNVLQCVAAVKMGMGVGSFHLRELR